MTNLQKDGGPASVSNSYNTLVELNQAVTECRECPRLGNHRETVARDKRLMYQDWEYWGRAVPGFGDPDARLVLLGLAPAAHGANRTGRMFTGDRSGDWVYGTLHRFGYASSPESYRRDDGMTLTDAYITAAVRCAPPDNKPLPSERANCSPYLVRELELLRKAKVILALGKFSFDAYLRIRASQGAALPSPRPKFGHCVVHKLEGGMNLLASYHPSQHNTLTGRLTPDMFDNVFATAQRLLAGESH